MGHISLNTNGTSSQAPSPAPPPPPTASADHPVLDSNIMQLVYSLYSAQLQLQQSHASLNNVEQSLHHAAILDPTLMPRAHFAYDALCQVLSMAGPPPPSSSANQNGSVTPNLAHPLTLSTALRPDHIDYDLFSSKYRTYFPGSDHLFPPGGGGGGAGASGSSSAGAPSNSTGANSAPSTGRFPPPLPPPTLNSWTPSPPLEPLDRSRTSPSFFGSNNAGDRRPYLPAPLSSSASSSSFPSFPPPHLPPLHYPNKSSTHLPPINPLSLIVAAAASEESAARSTIPTPTSPPPASGASTSVKSEHSLPWGARRGSGSLQAPNAPSSHWNAQLLLRASDVAEDQARERRKSMQLNDDEDEDAEGEEEEMSDDGMDRKRGGAKLKKRQRDLDDAPAPPQRGTGEGRRKKRKNYNLDGERGSDSDDDDDDDEEEYNDDDDDDDEEEEWKGSYKSSQQRSGSSARPSQGKRGRASNGGTPRGAKASKASSNGGGGSKAGSGADDNDNNKSKARRQPRSMEFDPNTSYPLNEGHHFLLVQTKPSQPELSDRCCTELFLVASSCAPTSPLARVLSGVDKAYTPSHYAEDVRLNSTYAFTSATGTSWIVNYPPRGQGGPTIVAASPAPATALVIGPPTTNTFVHLPPGSFVVNESPASPIGSLPWWRVQACVGATKHRGMPGPEGAWTARYDKDPRDRRPARILEHFAKCRWRQGEGEGAGAGGGDAIGRLARAVLGANDK